MTRKLIVNADDFGRTPGVTEGILRAHLEGIVTSTTAMMNMPGAALALQRARKECPRLGLGVHLVFSVGRPLLPTEWVSSLVDRHGHFWSQQDILSNPDRLDLAELKSELEAQIKTFQNATGSLPDHIDAHHFVHLLPPFFELYLELAEKFNLPARNPLPRHEDELAAYPPAGSIPIPRAQLEHAVRVNWDLLQRHPVRTTHHFVQSFFGDQALTVTHLLHILDSLPDGTTELMTHPGLADDALRQESRYTTQREKELALLCHPSVKQHIVELNIKLITFADL